MADISSEIERGAVERGMVKLNPAEAAGAGLSIDSSGNVSVGGIDTKTVGQVDYSGLIADAEARLGRIKEAGAKAPVAPKEPDLIDLQRREYFDKFYSGYVPRYEMNEIMQKLIDLPDADAQAFKDLYQSRYSPVAGMETPTGARRVRDLPTTPGGVIGGEGSPFVPTDRFSAKGREILGNIPSNQFYLEDMDAVKSDPRIQSLNQQLSELAGMADSTAGPMGGLSPFNIFASRLTAQRDALISEALQERANLLFREGFGLQKTLKEDGRILYTVIPFDRLGQYPADQVVMPDRRVLESQTLPTAPEEDMRLAQQNVRMGEGEPFNPAKYDAEIVALTGDLDRIATNLGFLKETAVSGTPEYDESRRLESEYAVKDELLNDLLMRRGNMQAKVDGAGIEPKKEYPITGDRAEVRRIQPTTALQARKKAPMAYDQSEMIPLNFGGGPVEITEDSLDFSGRVIPQQDELTFGGGVIPKDEPSLDLDSDAGFEALIQKRGVKALDERKPDPKVNYENLSQEEIDAAEEKRLKESKAAEEIKEKRRKEYEEAEEKRRKENERAKPTPQQTDAKVKFNAAEKAQSIYGTPEFNKLLNTELGKAVSDLYSVNKAKGDETGGEILSYIATEFPRAEDQSKAAQILMGLSYADKTKGLLKA